MLGELNRPLKTVEEISQGFGLRLDLIKRDRIDMLEVIFISFGKRGPVKAKKQRRFRHHFTND